MKVYNTLTRNKEEFKTIKDGFVGMYSCGYTVYNYAHIGNMRTYIFMDMLTRVLKYNGYKVKSVMNITDVGHLLSDADEGEDKMVTASKKLNKTPLEIADFYTNVFFEDLQKLNIEKPNVVPKATMHIKEMIDFTLGLVEKGYGYETSDGIYFDIQKFDGYGKLSRIKLDELMAGARVEVNTEKRNAYDFALWKKAPKEHIMQWESPWGMGYPGWHIECSAMSKKYLGENFDIHTGGVDHIPIHHENEIAQSEALTGKMSANYWMHGEFMLVDGGKMSKKLGNTYTVKQLEEKGYEPMVFRYFCLNAHYRNKINFTFEGMDSAKTSYQRLVNLLHKHKESTNNIASDVIATYKEKFENAINDDLNIPMALGIMWNLLKEEKSKNIYDLAISMDKIFGLKLKESTPYVEEEEEIEVPTEITDLANQRIEAKKNKDYALADSLRNKISELGFNIIDTKDGFTIKKK